MQQTAMDTGSVTDLRYINNAISTAKKVMLYSTHSSLGGLQATTFAMDMGATLSNLSTKASSDMYYDWWVPLLLNCSHGKATAYKLVLQFCLAVQARKFEGCYERLEGSLLVMCRKGKNCQPNFRKNVHPDPSKSCGPYKPLTQDVLAAGTASREASKNNESLLMKVSRDSRELAEQVKTGKQHMASTGTFRHPQS